MFYLIKRKFKSFVWTIINKSLKFYQTSVYNRFRRTYEIADTFKFNGKDILMYGDGEIIAGENSYVGDFSTWQTTKGYFIKIGKECQISHNVRCYAQSADANADFSMKPIPQKYGNVIIGNYVWIGANVFLNPGITIGSNAVIGANALVTIDVPEFEIVGGVLAKLIRFKKGNV